MGNGNNLFTYTKPYLIFPFGIPIEKTHPPALKHNLSTWLGLSDVWHTVGGMGLLRDFTNKISADNFCIDPIY
jgi:hypothetical protein